MTFLGIKFWDTAYFLYNDNNFACSCLCFCWLGWWGSGADPTVGLGRFKYSYRWKSHEAPSKPPPPSFKFEEKNEGRRGERKKKKRRAPPGAQSCLRHRWDWFLNPLFGFFDVRQFGSTMETTGMTKPVVSCWHIKLMLLNPHRYMPIYFLIISIVGGDDGSIFRDRAWARFSLIRKQLQTQSWCGQTELDQHKSTKD